MHITELFLSAFSGITNNKKRTFLTIFSIMVGITSVITILCVGQGLKGAINDQLDSFGVDQITITNKKNYSGLLDSADSLKISDIAYLKSYKPIKGVSAQLSTSFKEAVDIPSKDKGIDASLIGINEDYYIMDKHNILYGRKILKEDVESMSMVAVITNGLSNLIFGTENSVGKNLILKTHLGRLRFKIIGIEDDEYSFYDSYANVYVPISYVQMIKNNNDKLSRLIVKVNDIKNVNEFGNNIIRFLEIKNNTNNVYKYRIEDSEIKDINSTISMFTIFLTSVASISLLVGGVGVMNIMLVSVTERTKEIGTRKSLGATNANIKLQFLIESAILSGLGGIIGILSGLSLGFIITSFASTIFNMKILPSISILSIVVVISISCSIGILFGVYPASKAAKLDPVESLRFE